MAKYIVQEINDLNKTGKKQAYARVDLARNISFEELMEICSKANGAIPKSSVAAVMRMLTERMAMYMGLGYSVTLDGLGTFHAKLGAKKDVDSEELDKYNRKPSDLCVTGIHFRANKELISETNERCTLERSGTREIKRTPYSKEERLQLALGFIEKNRVLHVMDYVALTQLPKSTATKELNLFSEDPSSGIVSQGKHSHKIYVKK